MATGMKWDRGPRKEWSGVEWRVSVLGGGLAADENGFQGVCDATKAGVSRGLLW